VWREVVSEEVVEMTCGTMEIPSSLLSKGQRPGRGAKDDLSILERICVKNSSQATHVGPC
jgi:hypothetical protein